MHYELSTIHFFQPITREDVDIWVPFGRDLGIPFLCPSDLYERQDSDDLDLCDLEDRGGEGERETDDGGVIEGR